MRLAVWLAAALGGWLVIGFVIGTIVGRALRTEDGRHPVKLRPVPSGDSAAA